MGLRAVGVELLLATFGAIQAGGVFVKGREFLVVKGDSAMQFSLFVRGVRGRQKPAAGRLWALVFVHLL